MHCDCKAWKCYCTRKGDAVAVFFSCPKMDNLLTSHAATAYSAIIVGFHGAHSKRLSLSLSLM